MEKAENPQEVRRFQSAGDLSFAEFLDDEETSDATIICSDGVMVYVHRLLLIKKSTEFKKIFAALKEQHKTIGKLTNIDSETLKEVLKFAYTGSADIKNIHLVNKVYWAAVVYDMPELQLQCANLLSNLINSENVLEILEVTNELKLEMISEKCLQYMMKYK